MNKESTQKQAAQDQSRGYTPPPPQAFPSYQQKETYMDAFAKAASNKK